jgi:acyl-CoA synthetase (AMP-forming)/AMP-acid ligase II
LVATDVDGIATLSGSLASSMAIAVDGAAGRALRSAQPHETALVQPSSGTTGDPKGVVVSQRALLANLAAISAHWNLGPSDSGLSWLPLFHDMGLIGTAINAVFTGATLYQWPTASFLRSPGRWVELLGETGVTVAVAPPFALELATRRWRRSGGEADLSRLRHVLVGAERIRPEVLEGFAAAFTSCGLAPDALCPTYGLAEATLAVTAKPLGEAFRSVRAGAHRWTSCGRAVPGVELRIDASTDEVMVASPGLMDGYLDDPLATDEVLTDGWLRTGDCGRMVDGELVVTGRAKEMINRGGVRLPASDYEIAVHGVDGVLPDRAVAFGDLGPDGERVVVLAESRQRGNGSIVLALRARLADAGLAADVVELVPPGFIPRTTSGKLRRGAAREHWRAQEATAASN